MKTSNIFYPDDAKVTWHCSTIDCGETVTNDGSVPEGWIETMHGSQGFYFPFEFCPKCAKQRAVAYKFEMLMRFFESEEMVAVEVNGDDVKFASATHSGPDGLHMSLGFATLCATVYSRLQTGGCSADEAKVLIAELLESR
jgi:hypothetical protein